MIPKIPKVVKKEVVKKIPANSQREGKQRKKLSAAVSLALAGILLSSVGTFNVNSVYGFPLDINPGNIGGVIGGRSGIGDFDPIVSTDDPDGGQVDEPGTGTEPETPPETPETPAEETPPEIPDREGGGGSSPESELPEGPTMWERGLQWLRQTFSLDHVHPPPRIYHDITPEIYPSYTHGKKVPEWLIHFQKENEFMKYRGDIIWEEDGLEHIVTQTGKHLVSWDRDFERAGYKIDPNHITWQVLHEGDIGCEFCWPHEGPTRLSPIVGDGGGGGTVPIFDPSILGRGESLGWLHHDFSLVKPIIDDDARLPVPLQTVDVPGVDAPGLYQGQKEGPVPEGSVPTGYPYGLPDPPAPTGQVTCPPGTTSNPVGPGCLPLPAKEIPGAAECPLGTTPPDCEPITPPGIPSGEMPPGEQPPAEEPDPMTPPAEEPPAEEPPAEEPPADNSGKDDDGDQGSDNGNENDDNIQTDKNEK